MLEVHQFAQEAVVADAWLTAQEPLLQSRELGSSVDEVEQLIRRHEAFRKAAAAWEERFSSLRRLTTVSTQNPDPAPVPPPPSSYIRQMRRDLVLRPVSSEARQTLTGLPGWGWGWGETCQQTVAAQAGWGSTGLWEPRSTWSGLGWSDRRQREWGGGTFVVKSLKVLRGDH